MSVEKKRFGKIRRLAATTIVGTSICLAGMAQASTNHWGACGKADRWLSGDFHQHTYYTDGSTTFDFVMEKNNAFGLDWWANSEHGGRRNRDGEGDSWLDTSKYPENPILGDNSESGYMYRWQSLRDFVYPDILENRSLYSGKKIFSGFEWNVPAHEHCSVAVVSESMGPLAISAFEYQFDRSDNDTSRTGEWTPFGVLEKQNNTHEDTVAACAWMQDQYQKGMIDNAWIIFAHIERAEAYQIEHFRDFNNAAPDICFGFEGAPGHQVNGKRGFGRNPGEAYGGAFGGVGSFTAQVGGLWDALLGEGRHWFNYANSDYHQHWTAGGSDFYPGEYQRTWVNAIDFDRDGEFSLNEIADGLRSGNAYFVHGDLINALEFSAQGFLAKAVMGQDMHIRNHSWKKPVKITIKFKSPETNNNGDHPVVDHIDLIAGRITGKIDPQSPDYGKATNDTTKVMATFTQNDWQVDGEGYNVITYWIDNLNASTYFRLRGTNLAVNTAYETDAEGNPLSDFLATDNLGLDGADEAWADLWFYSNPIFVHVD